MLAKTLSAAVRGIEAVPLEIEVDVRRSNFPAFLLLGLPDAAVRESSDRVRSAFLNAGYDFAWDCRITCNLAPATLKKEGSVYDLPIAVGLLAATDQVAGELLERYLIAGELALDGAVRPIKGALSIAMLAREQKRRGVILPSVNANEAGVVGGIEVIGVGSLREAVGFLNRRLQVPPTTIDLAATFRRKMGAYDVDFAEVRGQEHVKRALTVAAAGGHNLLMIGPPGSGKTMLARRLPSILPILSLDESLETTRIHSVAGALPPGTSLLATRPFRAPHHTISTAGLVGGGSFPRPGELSLSHHGVLFLDELPEFQQKTLEVLRQPLEEGSITIGRAAGSITYPAKVMLVAAMNPCPCGYHGDPKRECRCSPKQIQQYVSKISGPLLDRIDIHIEVPAVLYRELRGKSDGTSSAEIRRAVEDCRRVQSQRFAGEAIYTNGSMGSKHLKRWGTLGDEAEAILKQAMDTLHLSARAFSKILKVSRTIADLEHSAEISPAHLSEAIQYRNLDRPVESS
ncbi:MAG: YifB family Mg chelatase-like AAA ATPase [Planctomycetes bacterium]|nr:YifB family Mg chelatase-like AAA ATPase [Planctomycetota bacterium]